jgi:hypothetical protein
MVKKSLLIWFLPQPRELAITLASSIPNTRKQKNYEALHFATQNGKPEKEL